MPLLMCRPTHTSKRARAVYTTNLLNKEIKRTKIAKAYKYQVI